MPRTKAGVEYKEAELDAAIVAVHMGMPVRRAAAMFGVPKSTLQDKISGKVPVSMRKGPTPYLSMELEDQIESWLVKMARIGYGQMRLDVINKVQELVVKLKILTPFPDAQPSHKWYQLFMNWHPDIKARMAQALSQQCSDVSYDDLLSWFNGLQSYLVQNGYLDILKDPSRIYNCDEMGFPMAPKPGKVLASKGDAHVYQASTSSSKAQITTLLAASASGHYIPLMIIYPGVQPCNQLREDFHN